MSEEVMVSAVVFTQVLEVQYLQEKYYLKISYNLENNISEYHHVFVCCSYISNFV